MCVRAVLLNGIVGVVKILLVEVTLASVSLLIYRFVYTNIHVICNIRIFNYTIEIVSYKKLQCTSLFTREGVVRGRGAGVQM